MRILRIIPSMNPSSGGPCQGIRNIIPELQQLGQYHEVVCLDNPADDYIGRDPFKVVALGPGKGPWCYSTHLVPWLVNNFIRFDIVIVHALWLYHGYAVKKALSLYNKSLINSTGNLACPKLYIMPHGMLDPYFQQAAERKLKAIRNKIYWKWIESKLVNEADGLLFTCQQELLLARISFQTYHPKSEINIGYGVKTPPPFDGEMATAFFERCPQVVDLSFILFLSRIHAKKGIDHLIEGYQSWVNQLKTAVKEGVANYTIPKLVIAGPGLDSAYGREMQQLVSIAGLNEMVFFPGMLSGKEKWGAFYNAEAFILPSHQENFGIAVVEALACGTPVLISDQVNIWQEIMETGGGITRKDTTAGVVSLLDDWQALKSEEKKAMGIRAYDTFIKYFSIKHAAKRFCQLVTNDKTYGLVKNEDLQVPNGTGSLH